jgi:hypothetical protein
MVMSPFMNRLSKLTSIKKTMTALPIIRKQANVTPLVVGDDLALRTSLTSPVFYDREMVKLLHNHIEFLEEDIEGKEPEGEINFNRFSRETSNIDKLSLLWALFKATYETLGKRNFTCGNENCERNKKPFQIEVLLDNLIHEDTFTIWEEDEPFNKFRYQIDVPYENLIYQFSSKLPSINDNNRLLSTMSNEVLQSNLDNLGSVYSRAQNMALLVDAIRIVGNEQNADFEPIQTDNLQEILMSLNSYIPYKVSESFFKEYNEKFNKYLPKFYKTVECPSCGKEVRNDFDLEVEFFRRSLFGSRESE